MNDLKLYTKITPYEDFLNDKIPERRFRLVYANKETFYLTQLERDHLLNAVGRGDKYIQIGEHTFTGSFIALYPIKENIYKKEFEIVKDEKGNDVARIK